MILCYIIQVAATAAFLVGSLRKLPEPHPQAVYLSRYRWMFNK